MANLIDVLVVKLQLDTTGFNQQASQINITMNTLIANINQVSNKTAAASQNSSNWLKTFAREAKSTVAAIAGIGAAVGLLAKNIDATAASLIEMDRIARTLPGESSGVGLRSKIQAFQQMNLTPEDAKALATGGQGIFAAESNQRLGISPMDPMMLRGLFSIGNNMKFQDTEDSLLADVDAYLNTAGRLKNGAMGGKNKSRIDQESEIALAFGGDRNIAKSYMQANDFAKQNGSTLAAEFKKQKAEVDKTQLNEGQVKQLEDAHASLAQAMVSLTNRKNQLEAAEAGPLKAFYDSINEFAKADGTATEGLIAFTQALGVATAALTAIGLVGGLKSVASVGGALTPTAAGAGAGWFARLAPWAGRLGIAGAFASLFTPSNKTPNSKDEDDMVKDAIGKPMARGGIVTGPTNILAGEAGAEAIIPLSALTSKEDTEDAVRRGIISGMTIWWREVSSSSATMLDMVNPVKRAEAMSVLNGNDGGGPGDLRRGRGGNGGKDTESGVLAFDPNKSDLENAKAFIAGIESKGKYNIRGGAGNHYIGKYQFGRAAINDVAKSLGTRSPTDQEFLNNPAMQEQYMDGLMKLNNSYLMTHSDKYRGMSEQQRLSVLGYAHNQGAAGAAKWLRTGIVGYDKFLTGGDVYSKGITATLLKLHPNMKTAMGTTNNHSTDVKIAQIDIHAKEADPHHLAKHIGRTMSEEITRLANSGMSGLSRSA